MSLRILLADVTRLELLRRHGRLFLHRLCVGLSELKHALWKRKEISMAAAAEWRNDYSHLDALLVGGLHLLPILEPQPLCPVLLVQVQEHGLLEIRFSVGDGDRVVVTVQAVDQSLAAKEQEVVSCCLTFHQLGEVSPVCWVAVGVRRYSCSAAARSPS